MATTLEASPATEERIWSPRVNGTMLSRLAARADVPADRDPLPVQAPFTGETLGAVPHATPNDMRAACRAAREAQLEWAGVPVAERARLLLAFHDLLIANADEILDIVQLESGKARRHALEEVLDTAVTARYYAHTAADFLRPHRRQGALPVLTQTVEYRHPKGVVGFVTPWNYPLVLGITDALPALVAGNGVVVKPDAQTPFSALWAARLLEEAGLPRGILQVVTGRGAELGPAMVEEIDCFMLTGSTATGKRVACMAAERLIDYSLELGGKNALIVLDDADIGRAVAGTLRGVTANTGQLCISIERIYAHSSLYDEFASRLAADFAGVRLGNSLTWADDVGSLASADQLAKVKEHVDDAVAKGATVLAGGQPRPDLGPYFFEPTLLADVPADAVCAREETFGPVAALYRFETEDEVVARANDTTYGLNASVWTRRAARGRELAQRLRCGTVNVNEAYGATWSSASPMGGFNESGAGRRHGEHGILKFTEAQTVAVQHLLAIDTPPFLSHAQYAAIMLRAVKALKYLPGWK
jgi:succinate-semialdehyde dehydrogenase / glutarate-semialdehyde dehydrogenase